MPEAAKSIFTQKATNKLRSPEDLDKVIRVTSPSVWVILIACVALLVGLLAWGVFGSVSTNVTTTGAKASGRVMCFLSADDVVKVHVGDHANVGGGDLTVASISKVPMSREEVKEMLKSDYLVSSLMTGDWGYVVTFAGDEAAGLEQNLPLATSIVVERIAPISIVFGSAE